ncbi:hypothetical protein ATKI12_2748 [Kitasatospora sp. Ki12]
MAATPDGAGRVERLPPAHSHRRAGAARVAGVSEVFSGAS